MHHSPPQQAIAVGERASGGQTFQSDEVGWKEGVPLVIDNGEWAGRASQSDGGQC